MELKKLTKESACGPFNNYNYNKSFPKILLEDSAPCSPLPQRAFRYPPRLSWPLRAFRFALWYFYLSTCSVPCRDCSPPFHAAAAVLSSRARARALRKHRKFSITWSSSSTRNFRVLKRFFIQSVEFFLFNPCLYLAIRKPHFYRISQKPGQLLDFESTLL